MSKMKGREEADSRSARVKLSKRKSEDSSLDLAIKT